MNFPLTLVSLAGSVALLLWGVRMVQTGVQRAFGARLRSALGRALQNRLKAFLAGASVTAILQSGTATGLMITGFAAGGLVELVPALAVMLGANVGTTLIVQVLSFNVNEAAPALILIGVLMFQRATAGPRDFGRVLIGLGLILMALNEFVTVSVTLRKRAHHPAAAGGDLHAAGAGRDAGRGPDLGDAFQRGGGAGHHVLRGQRHGAAGSGVRAGARRESGNRDQSRARRRDGRRSGRTSGAARQPAQSRSRRGRRADPLAVHQPVAGAIRSRPRPRGCRFPHHLQPRAGGHLPAAARSLCRVAAAMAAGPGRSGGSIPARCISTRGTRDTGDRPGRRRARGAAAGGRPGNYADRPA